MRGKTEPAGIAAANMGYSPGDIANATSVIVDANYIALRSPAVRKHLCIPRFRIAALRSGAVNIHELIFSPARWKLHPAQCPAKADINRRTSGASGWPVQLRR